MTTPAFAQPGGGGFFKPADHSGHLILVTAVHETFMRHDDMAGKEKLHARLDYACLDCEDSTLVESSLTSHPGIAGRLQPHAGKGTPVLGRIGQAPSKNGHPAWVLGPYTEGTDDVRAQQWMSNGALAQPSVPTATPQQSTATSQQSTATAPTAAPPAAAATVNGVALTPEQVAAMKELGIEIPANA